MSYQNFKNKETWAVHLWIGEDPYLSEAIVERIDPDDSKEDVEDIIQDVVTEYIRDLAYGEEQNAPPNLASDLIETAISGINWRELASIRYEEFISLASEQED